MRVYNPTTGLEREMTEQEVRQVRMFGCTEQQMREAVEQSLTFRFSGAAMYAMSLMSDAQEEILRDMNEDARQTLNRAKWILSTYCMDNE
jgi:hypothetical protein